MLSLQLSPPQHNLFTPSQPCSSTGGPRSQIHSRSPHILIHSWDSPVPILPAHFVGQKKWKSSWLFWGLPFLESPREYTGLAQLQFADQKHGVSEGRPRVEQEPATVTELRVTPCEAMGPGFLLSSNPPSFSLLIVFLCSCRFSSLSSISSPSCLLRVSMCMCVCACMCVHVCVVCVHTCICVHMCVCVVCACVYMT